MVLESTIICVDSSDFMRNGDFLPTRLQAQQDAVNLVCHSKTRANPENNIGLLTMTRGEVLVTLTSDSGRILSKLHQVQPKGQISLATSVKIAHLALKHRQGRNHKTRIVVFVGSPVHDDEKDLIKLAKKLKKEKVNVDIINFGEEDANTEKLTNLINTINGKDGTGSHLVTVPAGPTSMLSDALLNSPVIVGEDGAGANIGGPGFEFGFDANEDPELALALRVSMEEQRARQEDEAKKAAAASVAETGTKTGEGSNEETLLEQAIAMSMQQDTPPAVETPSMPDLSSMSEEQQIAYAMQMSLQAESEESATPMDVDIDKNEKEKQKEEKEKDEAKGVDDDYSDVMSDPEFLQSVLSNLPGVDPNSEAIRNAMSSITKKDSSKKDDKKDSKDKDKK